MRLVSACELKKLCPRGLTAQAKAMRAYLIETISETGGHLASNLGVVEIALALHYVLNTPHDKIVWDVGHQCYAHKLLTGRAAQFDGLRIAGGISGFPTLAESPHDAFGTGHSSTAISAALGLALARDMSGGDGHVVAVVGDGSLTGGLAYEGLNNAGRSSSNLLVLLNDNEMSISKNVGALQRHLSEIRASRGYQSAKDRVHRALDRMPNFGSRLTKYVQNVKETIKFAILPGVLFREMGFRYLGPMDGHDAPGLVAAIRSALSTPGPVLLHAVTTKGKGFGHAEDAPRKYHGVGPFCKESGKPAVKNVCVKSESFTESFGKHIVRLAETNDKICAITAAMADGVGLGEFAQKHRSRFFDVGIAEGHAVTFAAGLAAGGMKPVVCVYSSFLQRAYDQILHDVATQNLNVVFAIDHAGAVDADGPTHQGIYDIAFLSHIPNMTILAPASPAELCKMLDFALKHDGPVAIRYPKVTPVVSADIPPILLGRAQVVWPGSSIAIVAVGPMVHEAFEAAKLLDGKIEAAVINARFVKPIDMALVRELAGYTHVFCIEDGVRLGGYGQRLLAALSAQKKPPEFHIIAHADAPGMVQSRAEALAGSGMTADAIAGKVLRAFMG